MSEATWSPSPVGDTLAMIQKEVAGYVLMPTNPEVIDCAGQGIKRAVDRLNMRDWNWAITYDDITFVADYTEYSLNSQFKSPRNFEVFNPSGFSEFRLSFKTWKSFVSEHARYADQADPLYYSCRNVNADGLVTLNVAPTSGWIAQYPTGRLLYHRRIQYPIAAGNPLGVPSEAVSFIQAHAEGYVADRYAVEKARDAYMRSEILLRDLIRDDCHGQQTDWEC